MKINATLSRLVAATPAIAHEGHDYGQRPAILSDRWLLLLAAGALFLVVALGCYLWQRRRARCELSELEE